MTNLWVRASLLAGLVIVGSTTSAPVRAQYDPFIGQVTLFGFGFCPRGWAPAAGQLVPIAENSALFSLLGTIYGGDGRTTFALPDLRGRVPIGSGEGPGLTDYAIGQRGGAETVELDTSQIPSHTHPATTSVVQHGTSAAAATGDPTGALAANTGRTPAYARGTTVSMDEGAVTAVTTVAPAGGGKAHENRPPYLTMTWCMAMQGIYPSRE